VNKLLLSIFVILITFNFSYAEGILLGIAEDPSDWTPSPLISKTEPRVRILFHKEKDKWIALDSNDKQKDLALERVGWTIAFDGNNLGSLTTVDNIRLRHPDCGSCFSRDKIFRVENINKFPRLGNKSKRFSEWMGIPQNRPVVLVNAPNYKDKEKWKQFNPDKNILSRIFPKLKDTMGETYHCNGPLNWDAAKFIPTIKDVELYRSYKNINGKVLISAGISKRHLENCDGPVGPGSYPIWFYLGQDIKFVGYELDLLDVGDYDSDGKVEFIFHYSGYNSDGYTLFDNDFEQRYDYKWGYH